MRSVSGSGSWEGLVRVEFCVVMMYLRYCVEGMKLRVVGLE